jgi:ankyrin repeat protein
MTAESDITNWIRTGSNDLLQEYLAEHPHAADAKTAEGISLLMMAVYFGNKQAVRIISNHKTSLDIFEATCTGNDSEVHNLVNSRPELVNSVSPDGFSPLGYACFFNQAGLARYFLEKGADIQAASANSMKVTPLHSAAASSNAELVQLLVSSGANVHARQMSGYTPLHSASNNGNKEIIRILLEAGALVNEKTDNGETALFFAEKNGHKEAVELLLLKGGR